MKIYLLKNIYLLVIAFMILFLHCNTSIPQILARFRKDYPNVDTSRLCFVEYKKNVITLENCIKKKYLMSASDWAEGHSSKAKLQYLEQKKKEIDLIKIPDKHKKYYLIHLNNEIKRLSWLAHVDSIFDRNCVKYIQEQKRYLKIPNEFFAYIYQFKFTERDKLSNRIITKNGICAKNKNTKKEMLLADFPDGYVIIQNTYKGKYILVSRASSFFTGKDGTNPTRVELYSLNVLNKKLKHLFSKNDKNGLSEWFFLNGVLNDSESIINNKKNLYYFNHISGNLKKIITIPSNMNIGGAINMSSFESFYPIISSRTEKYILFPSSYDGIKSSFIVIDFSQDIPKIIKQPMVQDISLYYAFSTHDPMQFEEHK